MVRKRYCSYRRKQEYFICLLFLVVCVQIYFEYILYSINTSELRKVKSLVENKLPIDIAENTYLPTEKKDRNRSSAAITEYIIRSNEFLEVVIEQNTSAQVHASNKNVFQGNCNITDKFALSAIQRAKTLNCKQTVAYTACEMKSNKFPTQPLARLCPLKAPDYGVYSGCFQDSFTKRVLGELRSLFKEDNSVDKCINTCLSANAKYAGVQYGYECWCGNFVGKAIKLHSNKCNMTCPGNENESCGGKLTMDVYHTGLGETQHKDAPDKKYHDKGMKKVKIIFLLMLNSRRLRQIKQLFRMIYSPEHYYYVHIDKRGDYLYRELTPTIKKLTNVYVTEHRTAMLWGGNSILRVHLQCMLDILNMKHWKWSYYVNLSESHFPLRRLDDLVNYLSLYSGMNFVAGASLSVPRAVSQQEHIFVECDNYVWKIGTRPLLKGIVSDGGSDWFMLHYNFVQYIATSNDDLIVPLWHYLNYSMSAAEQFFHTLLVNSIFCTTSVNNNLHVIEWDRQRGCRCSDGIDTCLCSPKVQRQADFRKLVAQANSTHFKYFARKFDAMISQMVLTNLERVITSNQEAHGINMDSYWQSDYHYLDNNTVLDDVYNTYYHSFIRRGLNDVNNLTNGRCNIVEEKLLQIYTYSYKDVFKGLIIQTMVQENNHSFVMETLAEPVIHPTIYNVTNISNKIKHFDVGTRWEKREELFRNYGKLLGPYSNITVAILWKDERANLNMTFTLIYADPSLQVVGRFEIPVKSDDRFTTHVPNFKGPLRPGKWNIQLLVYTNNQWTPIVNTMVVILPLTYLNNIKISDEDAIKTHSGGPYLDNIQTNVKYKGRDISPYISQAKMNANKTGADLVIWVDNLSNSAYSLKETCFSNKYDISINCDLVSVCEKTVWSSLSPDPKSDLRRIFLEHS